MVTCAKSIPHTRTVGTWRVKSLEAFSGSGNVNRLSVVGVSCDNGGVDTWPGTIAGVSKRVESNEGKSEVMAGSDSKMGEVVAQA